MGRTKIKRGRPKKKVEEKPQELSWYEQTLQEEAKTWVLTDPKVFEDKRQREIVRYPMIARQMGLHFLDTTNMSVADVGAGPFGGVSTVLRCKNIVRIDPLAAVYAMIADVTSYLKYQAEQISFENFDLVISTNAIDHMQNPTLFLQNLSKTLKPGGYFAHFHAINNAVTHPHPAHKHNINPELVDRLLRDDFEKVWSLDYKTDGLVYGWRKQPAFAGLYRKVTGYGGK